MRPNTQQTRFHFALRMRGWQDVENPNARYGNRNLKMSHPDYPGRFVFLGTAGSLRVGKNKSTSWPVTSEYKQRLEAAWKDASEAERRAWRKAGELPAQS